MKVLVTGATGFIGKYVVERFIKAGYEIIGIGRTDTLVKMDNFQFCKVDIREEEQVNSFFSKNKDISGIVHLAADLNMQGTSQTIITNCLGTFLLAQKAVENKIDFFVNISSIPIIGKPISIPITEEHPAYPKTLYHITKLMSEQVVDNVCSGHMRTYNLRISSPIGVGMSSKNLLSVVINKCRTNDSVEVYGKGTRVQNYIDVRDIAEAILFVVNSNKTGLYLIAGKESISNIDLVNKCIQLLNSKSEIIIGKKIDIEEDNKWYISTEKIYKEVEFSPQYSLEDTIKWICNNKE